MTLTRALAIRASKASLHARTAILTECAERVFPVYEEYWIGSYEPAVRRSIELGWSYAYGLPADDAEIRSCRERVKDLVEFYCEEGIDVLAHAVTVVLRMLQSTSSNEEESCTAVGRGLIAARGTAGSAGIMADRGSLERAGRDAATTEEENWRNEALSLIEGWKGVAAPKMFDSLGGKPPQWLLDWSARRRRRIGLW